MSVPWNTPSPSMGMPMKRLAKVTPSSRAGTRLDRKWTRSQKPRHTPLSTLPRNSKDTARKIRANSRTSRGAYRALNMTA